MKHVNDLIPAYLDGRLGEAGRAAVRAHCDLCPACAGALAESEAVWRLLDSVRVPAPSRPAWAGVAA
ncbi:zf-HC2 domain-containing protein, partial [bacterium]|nr:zf-HC2 domain-containing protein [bacterium]